MVKVKVFEVSVDKKRCIEDESALNQFIGCVKVKKTSTQFINGAFNCWSVMVFYEDDQEESRSEIKKEKSEKSEMKAPIKVVLNEMQEALLLRLKSWRQAKATELNLPVFMICRNNELEQLMLMSPGKMEDLESIKGFGKQKVAKYGKELMRILRKKE